MEKISAIAITVLLALSLSAEANALTIELLNTAVVENFNDFRGGGFVPVPGAGQLDSDEWLVRGLSYGDGVFGGSHDSGDFARGQSEGGETTGGVYAFDVDNGPGENHALGLQPGGSDFTPGSITLKILNSTGYELSALVVEYDLFVYNDQDRSNSFNFSYSADDTSYLEAADANFISPEAEDASPEWEIYNRSINIASIGIADTGSFYLRWLSDDISGSGSRDEFALDNLRITGFTATGSEPSHVPEPSTIILIASGLAGLALQRKKQR